MGGIIASSARAYEVVIASPGFDSNGLEDASGRSKWNGRFRTDSGRRPVVKGRFEDTVNVSGAVMSSAL